jgi:hypothetical protein
MKKSSVICTFFFVLTLIITSCEKVIKSDAERACELVADIKLTISEVSNAINEGADDADVEALNAKAAAIGVRIKEIQKRNEGNEEFMKLQQSCYETMNK